MKKILLFLLLLIPYNFSFASYQTYHTCAIDSTDTLRCWGLNTSGQTTVPGGYTWKSVDLGYNYTCGIDSTDVLRCWGDNTSGKATVPGGYTWKQVAVGQDHTCAIDSTDTLRCWGSNTNGKATVPGGYTWKFIGVGQEHSCGIDSTNILRCWGLNTSGQTTVPGGYTWKSVDGGYAHTCAIDSTDTLRCWGLNGNGQTTVPGGYIWKQVNNGGYFTCGIDLTDALRCWGLNTSGQTTVPGGYTWKQISSGYIFSCGITSSNNLLCWTYNSNGQTTVPGGYTWKSVLGYISGYIPPVINYTNSGVVFSFNSGALILSGASLNPSFSGSLNKICGGTGSFLTQLTSFNFMCFGTYIFEYGQGFVNQITPGISSFITLFDLSIDTSVTSVEFLNNGFVFWSPVGNFTGTGVVGGTSVSFNLPTLGTGVYSVPYLNSFNSEINTSPGMTTSSGWIDFKPVYISFITVLFLGLYFGTMFLIISSFFNIGFYIYIFISKFGDALSFNLFRSNENDKNHILFIIFYIFIFIGILGIFNYLFTSSFFTYFKILIHQFRNITGYLLDMLYSVFTLGQPRLTLIGYINNIWILILGLIFTILTINIIKKFSKLT